MPRPGSQWITLVLPKPPSSNHLFPTGKNGRRFRSKKYESWLKEAKDLIWLAQPQPIFGPVKITITIEDEGRVDLANHEKAIVDFLVKYNLIQDDKREIVRKITMQWGKVIGALVEVKAVESTNATL